MGSYLGRPRLTPERATVSSWSEETAEVVVVRKIGRRTEREGVFEARMIRGVRRQMPAQAGRSEKGHGEAVSVSGSDETSRPRSETESTGSGLLVAVLARENMLRAWKRVKANKGAAGIDGLEIDQTVERLRTEWPVIRDQLYAGTYRPKPVRRVTIRKPDGGERELGIPTVTDRLIQQALLQVLQPMLDPTFSEHSYGFRPGRSAHEAVLRAQSYVQSGRRVVVDVDLEKFFDRVNHDILIDRLQKRVGNAGVIRLIRAYLNSGIMVDGVLGGEKRERRRAGRYLRSWQMCCWTKWTRNWNGEATASCVMPMMRTSMSGAVVQAGE